VRKAHCGAGWSASFRAIARGEGRSGTTGVGHDRSGSEERSRPAPRGQSPTPLTLPLPAKRRGEGTASRSSVRMRPKCHLVGGREVMSVRAPSPRLFAGRGAVRGRAISRTVSNTTAAAKPSRKVVCVGYPICRGRRGPGDSAEAAIRDAASGAWEGLSINARARPLIRRCAAGEHRVPLSPCGPTWGRVGVEGRHAALKLLEFLRARKAFMASPLPNPPPRGGRGQAACFYWAKPRNKKVELGNANIAIDRHCEEPLRRSNPEAACCGPWIASLRSQ